MQLFGYFRPNKKKKGGMEKTFMLTECPIQKQVSGVLDFIHKVPMKRNFVQLFIDYIANIT